MKDKLDTLIVDDETLARNDLKAILKGFPQINIIAEADSLMKAKALLNVHSIDLVLLDIQLGRDNGFDLLPYISGKTKIVFVTAYDEYAIRAFEVNAQDYLLKPVSPERLALSLENLSESQKDEEVSKYKKLNQSDNIFIRVGDAYEFFSIERILFISAADDYTEVYTRSGEKKLVLKPLKEWEARLPENQFCRIHRSTIINILEVEKIEPWFNHSHRVFLKDYNKPLMMSRRYFSSIKKRLG